MATAMATPAVRRKRTRARIGRSVAVGGVATIGGVTSDDDDAPPSAPAVRHSNRSLTRLHDIEIQCVMEFCDRGSTIVLGLASKRLLALLTTCGNGLINVWRYKPAMRIEHRAAAAVVGHCSAATSLAVRGYTSRPTSVPAVVPRRVAFLMGSGRQKVQRLHPEFVEHMRSVRVVSVEFAIDEAYVGPRVWREWCEYIVSEEAMRSITSVTVRRGAQWDRIIDAARRLPNLRELHLAESTIDRNDEDECSRIVASIVACASTSIVSLSLPGGDWWSPSVLPLDVTPILMSASLRASMQRLEIPLHDVAVVTGRLSKFVALTHLTLSHVAREVFVGDSFWHRLAGEFAPLTSLRRVAIESQGINVRKIAPRLATLIMPSMPRGARLRCVEGSHRSSSCLSWGEPSERITYRTYHVPSSEQQPHAFDFFASLTYPSLALACELIAP